LFRDGITPAAADKAVLDAIRLVALLLAEGVLLIHEPCAD
jgi:hypothetical protein